MTKRQASAEAQQISDTTSDVLLVVRSIATKGYEVVDSYTMSDFDWNRTKYQRYDYIKVVEPAGRFVR